MTSNEENLQPTTEIIEKEDRPLKRKVDRQAQKIHELTAQVSKLEAEAEEQAEALGSLQDERDDAQDGMKQALHDLERWKRCVAHSEGLKRTELKRLTEALKISQKEVTQLRNENRLREQTAQTDGKKLCHALTAVFHARRSEDAALESLMHLFEETGIYQSPAPDQGPSPAVAAVPHVKLPPPPGCDGFDSYSQAPSSPPSKATPPRRQYTIEQIEAWNPIATTQRNHGPEVAAAIWKSHPSRNRTNDTCPPTRPLPGLGGSVSRLRLPIGTPPTSSFAPALDAETRQLSQVLANGSSPSVSTATNSKAEVLARRSARQASSPIVVDGSI